MSKLTNGDNATATPRYYYNACSPKRKEKEVRRKKREQREEREYEACATSYAFCVTKWTGMATNTLFFITEGIVTQTLAGWK